MLIVRDYNNIMNLINEAERSLFKEHMFELDKIINRGINQYTWNMDVGGFSSSCRNNCELTLKKIKIFQSRQGEINMEMEKIQTTILTQIKKTLYDLHDFMDQQSKELKIKESNFKDSFEKIRGLLMSTYKDLFLSHGRHIQEKWLANVQDMDTELLKALKNSVKATLMDLQHHIKGEQ